VVGPAAAIALAGVVGLVVVLLLRPTDVKGRQPANRAQLAAGEGVEEGVGVGVGVG
jgi:hypothetical protein